VARLVSLALLAVGAAWPGDGWAQGAPPARSAPKVSAQEYEGWRQYSANCARCHGQDVLGNPVAADLLKAAGPAGPVEKREAFVSVVKAGRTSRGMPGFAKLLTDEQIDAIYAYVKGRADGRIPAGRPKPAGK
jgi:mono/diheme cytochrome c family protein